MQTWPACEEGRGCPLGQIPVSTGFQPLVQAAAALSTKRWPRRGVLVTGNKCGSQAESGGSIRVLSLDSVTKLPPAG